MVRKADDSERADMFVPQHWLQASEQRRVGQERIEVHRDFRALDRVMPR